MAAIDPHALSKAMDRAGITTTQLAREIGKSVSYTARIVNGSRRLKRNPVLRHDIARALDVPAHWIEIERPDPELAEALRETRAKGRAA